MSSATLAKQARPLGHRRQLRRARLALPRPADRHVRPPRARCSFYPAHHITMGEGGCVVTNDERLARIARSFRDWGRDCYCAGGENNTCGTRFSQQFGTLPAGYDHKYVYSHIGYNLKVTDMQAAIGCAQLQKLDGFIARAPRQLRSRSCEALRAVRGSPAPADGAAELGAVVVRVRDHRARGRRLHPRRPRQVPRGQPHRDAQPVRRQPAPASGLPGDPAPRRPRSRPIPTR